MKYVNAPKIFAAIFLSLSASAGSGPSILGAARTDDTGLATYYIKNGGDINAVDERGMTALMVAADRCSKKMVELLLKAGASICSRDVSGQSVLAHSCSSEIRELVLERQSKLSGPCLKGDLENSGAKQSNIRLQLTAYGGS